LPCTPMIGCSPRRFCSICTRRTMAIGRNRSRSPVPDYRKCSRHSGFGPKRSGLASGPPAARAGEATSDRNSRKHGANIAERSTQQHTPAISDTWRDPETNIRPIRTQHSGASSGRRGERFPIPNASASADQLGTRLRRSILFRQG
jgi:hypothetical protein